VRGGESLKRKGGVAAGGKKTKKEISPRTDGQKRKREPSATMRKRANGKSRKEVAYRNREKKEINAPRKTPD